MVIIRSREISVLEAVGLVIVTKEIDIAVAVLSFYKRDHVISRGTAFLALLATSAFMLQRTGMRARKFCPLWQKPGNY